MKQYQNVLKLQWASTYPINYRKDSRWLYKAQFSHNLSHKAGYLLYLIQIISFCQNPHEKLSSIQRLSINYVTEKKLVNFLIINKERVESGKFQKIPKKL